MNGPDEPARRPFGLLAVAAAIMCFSVSSTIIKKSGMPGTTLAFWRMVITAVMWWAILGATERRVVTRAELRRALVPGVIFGLNITLFFSGVTHTAVANAEFIGSLTPLIVVPAGALLYHERLNVRSLAFGLVSLTGLTIVLFNAPPRGEAAWDGNLMVVSAMLLWALYLLTTRRPRASMSVAAIMASVMPVASITILPIVVVRGEITDISGWDWLYVVVLAVLTGTVAHGLIVFAQHSVPVGTIGILQVAQPALAVGWAYLLLDQSLRRVQVVGMAMVISGLVAVVVTGRVASARQQDGELAGTAG